uniref:Uncharacterized protein n=1 Tax=Oryza brachyantha TaxID=4533 RepID=J3LIP6_ORYBR
MDRVTSISQLAVCLVDGQARFYVDMPIPECILDLEATTKSKLATLNEKLDILERKLEVLEVQVQAWAGWVAMTMNMVASSSIIQAQVYHVWQRERGYQAAVGMSSGGRRRSMAGRREEAERGGGRGGGGARSDGAKEEEEEEERERRQRRREELERVVGRAEDATFSGADLAALIRSKYGRSYDVTLIRKEFMGRSLLAMNVMWKYREQRSFPLTEEEYLLRLDDVAASLRCWGAVSHVRSSLANLKDRPRIGKAVSIFIDMPIDDARSNEWIYK